MVPVEGDGPNSTKQPGDATVEDDPPSQRARTAPQMGTAWPQGDEAFRDRLRTAPYDSSTPTATAPHMSTPEDIEDALRQTTAGWPAHDVMYRMGNPGLPPVNPFVNCSLDGVSPLHVFVRIPSDPVYPALSAHVAGRVSQRDFSMLAGEPGTGAPLARQIPTRPMKKGQHVRRIGFRLEAFA